MARGGDSTGASIPPVYEESTLGYFMRLIIVSKGMLKSGEWILKCSSSEFGAGHNSSELILASSRFGEESRSLTASFCVRPAP